MWKKIFEDVVISLGREHGLPGHHWSVCDFPHSDGNWCHHLCYGSTMLWIIYSLDKVDIVQRKQYFFGDSSSCQTLYNITQKYILVGVNADVIEEFLSSIIQSIRSLFNHLSIHNGINTRSVWTLENCRVWFFWYIRDTFAIDSKSWYIHN